MRFTRRHPAAIALLIAAAFCGAQAAPAAASTSQVSIFETGGEIFSNPVSELQILRSLGVDQLRLFLPWQDVAPDPTSRTRPKGFNGASPAAYPAANWGRWDALIAAAKQEGITVGLNPAGRAPLWAMPKNTRAVAQGSNDPNASEFGAFVEALGKRYSGHYTPPNASSPLPRISSWSVWNEPNYISSLQPQGTGHNGSIPNTPHIYRNLVDAAWKGLHASGHGGDTVLIGELAPRGYNNFGTHSHGYMFPITFVRSMYCVDSHYHALRGSTASAEGCPTSSAGSRRFRAQNPALFSATGFSDHPYQENYAPNHEGFSGCRSGLCSSLATIGGLTSALDKAQHTYGSHKKFPIYSTEFGYKTNPPLTKFAVPPATAAIYDNWAEYMSYKNPRIGSYDQYLLIDPTKPGQPGDYASGLLSWDGQPKADYAAWRLPLYLPKTSASSSSQKLEVWGDARPAHFAAADTGAAQSVAVEFEASGSSTWSTLQTIPITNRQGYFDTKIAFPHSGSVRLAYDYPPSDPLLSQVAGSEILSRTVGISVK